MAIAAHDPADRADQLLGVVERLDHLMKAEITALSEGRLDASSSDWQEKEKLAHAYRLEIARIQQDPSLIMGIDTALKDKLMGAIGQFQETLGTHASAINGMKSVTEGLVRAISEEIAEVRSAPAGYGAAGLTSTRPREGASGIAANLKA